MTRLAYRPVVCGDCAVLPPPGGGVPVSMPLHYGPLIRGRAFHPDRPSLAICQLSAFTRPSMGEIAVLALVVSAERLRLMAAEMLAIADELDVKPSKAAAR